MRDKPRELDLSVEKVEEAYRPYDDSGRVTWWGRNLAFHTRMQGVKIETLEKRIRLLEAQVEQLIDLIEEMKS